MSVAMYGARLFFRRKNGFPACARLLARTHVGLVGLAGQAG